MTDWVIRQVLKFFLIIKNGSDVMIEWLSPLLNLEGFTLVLLFVELTV